MEDPDIKTAANGRENTGHSQLPFTAPGSYLSVDAAEAYDSKRFAGPHGRLRSALQVRALKACIAPLAQELAVLEVACGTGRLTVLLRNSFTDVKASDISPAMLAVARARLGRTVSLSVADARCLPFPDKSVDMVAAFFLLGHAPPSVRQLMFREFRRVTRKFLTISIPLVDEAFPRTLRKLTRRQHPFRNFYPTTKAGITGELRAAGFVPTGWAPSLRLVSGTWFLLAELDSTQA
jgi:SAM-dependent methyltransferase